MHLSWFLQVLHCIPIFGQHVASYTSYGDELQNALRFFNLSTFNEVAYFTEHRRCYSLPGIWTPNNNGKLEQCFLDVNRRFQQNAALWKPVKAQPPLWLIARNDPNQRLRHVELDCRYNIFAGTFKHSARSNDLEYTFYIVQTACKTHVSEGEGTTFEIFGMNNFFLAFCVSEYHGNSKYLVICRFPMPRLEFHGIQQNERRLQCLNLTVIIYHEHFDSFSEVLSDPQALLEEFYVHARAVLSDNRRFCFPEISVDYDSQTTSGSFIHHENMFYYSALWTSFPNIDQSASESFKHFGNGSFHTSIEHSQWLNTTKLKFIFANLSEALAKDMLLTVPSMSMISPEQLAARFTYNLVKISSNGIESIPRNFMKDTSFFAGDEVIHFIGASHARYFYDAMHEMTYGPDGNDASNRKHSSTSDRRFVFSYVRLADDVADLLVQICDQKKNAKVKVVMHVGPWDFAAGSLRLFLRESNNLPKLLKVVDAIIDGTQKCSTMVTLVWLLQAPFPVGYDDSTFINRWRFNRFNPAIAAANKYILDFLLLRKPRRNSTTQLAIVDMFSIIRPRLAFDEEAELACVSHFVCRIDWDRDSATIWTMGGKSTFDAVVHALRL